MDKLESGDTLDRLSELPDSLILKILSSLEMRDVVRTTFLSKRWTDLWTTIPSLCFVYDYISHDNQKEIRNFINEALFLWKGSIIQKFKIRFCGDIRESLYRYMNWWLRFVTEKKVEELYLDFPSNAGPIPLPHFLFECSSIRQLSIVGDCNLNIRGDVHWDQLKSLMIVCYSFTEDVISRVVSGAPQLEIFDLNIISYSDENLSVRSSSLKKLLIQMERYYYDPSAVLTIWTPNLETLKISGVAYGKCLLMDVSSLTDVTLDCYSDETRFVEILGQILPTFLHVEKLTLSSLCFKVLAVMKAEFSFSPLSNVKLLRLTVHYLITLNEVVCLLEIFPKLNMLHINIYIDRLAISEPLNYEVNTIKSFMMRLRIVEIGLYKYEKLTFQFVEFFLKHATMLEKIVIIERSVVESYHKYSKDDMIFAAEKLLSLQRSFPTVELIFCKER